ncbi:MAG: O-antigen ligase family protein [Bacteroidetes bacterium]|nr:O-antigen ligase family protein [Bacteroidota bacterium]
MKEIFYIEDTSAGKISYYLLLVFLVTLPLDRIYSELSLIGLLLHTLLHLGKGRPWSLRWAGWLVAGLFLLMAVSAIYAPNFGDAGKQLEKQLAILLFPLIAWFSQLDWTTVRERLLKAFAWSCFGTVVYLYGCAFVSIYENGLGFGALFAPEYLNHAFSAPLDLHATYLSMYVAVAMVVFISMAVKDGGGSAARWGYWLIVLVLMAAMLQLASRAVFLAFLVVLNVLVPWMLLKGRTRWLALGGFLLVSVMAVTLVTMNDNLNTRYLVQLKYDMQRVRGGEGDAEPRMVRWGCAWELIRARPLTGYGVGAEVPKLKEEYYAHDLTISYKHELNAHNQYLSYVLNGGVAAGLWYLAVLGAGAGAAVRRRDIFLGTVVVVVAFVSFSENVLDTNKGIFFFSCFFTLFLYRPRSAGMAG